jgi:protein-S-isoprenylcysteine O-methyltransferase Ste14
MELNKELDVQGNFLFKYRGILPLIALGLGIAVHAYEASQLSASGKKDIGPEYYDFICLGVCFLGLIIRILTVGFTPKNTSGRNTDVQLADQLNTSGMYSIVRHPLYVGNFFMWLGVAMLTGHTWFVISFTLLYWLYYERIMFTEERFISRKFGDYFQEWAAKTPAIIPYLQQWKNPDRSFSLRKVLRQEKNGFFAIFLLFFIFDSVGEYMAYGNIEFRNLHWLVLCLASGVIYLVLKIVKRKTDLLKD